MISLDQWLTIMGLNVLFQAQAQRPMQTTMAIQISTIDQIAPSYQIIMKFNIFFQGQAKRVKRVKKGSTEIPKQLQKEFEDVFTGIGCFDGLF